MKVYVSYDDVLTGEVIHIDEKGKYVIRIQTNADRIRAMSDEELADCLGQIEQGDFWADLSWIEWLKQEVE